jgi:hypothetical protein
MSSPADRLEVLLRLFQAEQKGFLLHTGNSPSHFLSYVSGAHIAIELF